MKSDTCPISRKDNIVTQELENEVLIYDLNRNKAFCMNQTATAVWDECDGNKSVANIAQILSQKFKTPVSEEYIWLTLNKLKSEELLSNSDQISKDFNGLSRREVIKKVGLSSLIALPLISSLVAPTSVSAQSLVCDCFADINLDARPQFCPCASNNDCCGNCNGGTMTCSGPLIIGLDPGAPCCPPNIPVP